MKNFFTQLSDILALHKVIITALLVAATVFTMAFRYINPQSIVNTATIPINSRLAEHDKRLDSIELRLAGIDGKLDIIIRMLTAKERAK